MSYLVAAIGLGTFCALWFALQRWAGTLGEPPCGHAERDCDSCELDDRTGATTRDPIR